MIDDKCPHCEDGHESPYRCAWAVWVGAERDHDGQPVSLRVQPTNGSHVAEEDAEWLRRVIREWKSRPPEDKLRARILREVAAELSTLARAVQADGSSVFSDGGQHVAGVLAGYVESWADRPDRIPWQEYAGSYDANPGAANV